MAQNNLQKNCEQGILITIFGNQKRPEKNNHKE